MKNEIRYIELKSNYNDNGPAWICKVKLSKSGRTIYFNDKAFRKGLTGPLVTIMISKQEKFIGYHR